MERLNKNFIFKFILVISIIFFLNVVSAAEINDTFHLNIQTTFANGSIQNGTFVFAFNITESSSASCGTPIVYNYSTTKTTDSRGITSIYLPQIGTTGNLSNLNYDRQYYLCYYRDGTLKDVTQLSRVPYSFRATQVNLSEVTINSNLTLGNFNISGSSGFFSFLGSLTNRITTLFATDVNISNNVDIGGNLTVNQTLLVNQGGVGIGINPSSTVAKLFVISNNSSFNIARFQSTDTINGFARVISLVSNGTLTAPAISWVEGSSETAMDFVNNTKRHFYVNGATRVTIDTFGLGINTTTPNNLLNVIGDANITTNLTVNITTLFVNANNQRVGIGTRTPNQTLDVFGNITFNSSILAPNGSLSIPAYSFDLSKNTGIFLVSGGMSFVANGSQSFTVSSSNGDVSLIGGRDLLIGALGQIQADDLGNASFPAYAFNLDTDTGIYSGGSDSNFIGFSTAGVNKMVINGSNVGIGTTTPQNTLNVVGDLNVTGTSYLGNIVLSAQNITVDNLLNYSAAGINIPNNLTIGKNLTVDSGTLFVDSNNNGVGIGTRMPNQTLDIIGKIYASGNFKFNDTNLSISIGTDAGNTLQYVTALGYQAGLSNTAAQITAIGSQAGQSNIGASLTALGTLAGFNNTQNSVTTIGYRAGHSNTGSSLTSIGLQAGQSNAGAFVIAMGLDASSSNTGNQILALGTEALKNNTGNDVVAIGYQAGLNNVNSNAFILQQANINSVPLIWGNFSSGRVGINTTTPQQALNVFGAINSTTGFIVNSSTGVTANYSVGTCWIAYKGGIAIGSNCTAF